MRYLGLAEVTWLHDRIIGNSGGSPGLRDLGLLEAALAQPPAAFDGLDLYPDLIAKASSLCFSLVNGHAFVDGNKRIGHAAMEMFLLPNGARLVAEVDEQERLILDLAAGSLSRQEMEAWIRRHTIDGPG
jgi:death-on-curing protein